MVGVLTLVYGVPPTEALAIALVDRAISVLSIIIFGSIAYWFSPKRRGEGLEQHVRPTRCRSRSALNGACGIVESRVRRARRYTSRSRRSGAIRAAPRPTQEGLAADPSTSFESLPVIRVRLRVVSAFDARRYPMVSRPHRRRPHPTGPASLRVANRRRYQRVIQEHGPFDRIVRASRRLLRVRVTERTSTDDDHPERSRVQRMAASPAQGQEDVAAPARPAVGRRSLDHLPADPRRSDAVARAPPRSWPAACASCATTPTRRSTSAWSPPAPSTRRPASSTRCAPTSC